jgi:hypothetical protein
MRYKSESRRSKTIRAHPEKEPGIITPEASIVRAPIWCQNRVVDILPVFHLVAGWDSVYYLWLRNLRFEIHGFSNLQAEPVFQTGYSHRRFFLYLRERELKYHCSE